MPMDRSRYPADWDEVTARIRERAGDICEWPGCGLPNGAWVHRRERDLEQWTPAHDWPSRRDRVPPGYRKAIRVVLTVAHLDHDTTNNDPANLRAWCQLHHIRHDAELHAENAAATRARKRREQEDAAGQGRMFGG